MQKKLIKLLLNKEFYDRNRHRVARTMFAGELEPLFDTITEGHARYDRSLTLDELRVLYATLHPNATKATKNNIGELLNEVEAEGEVGPDVGEDVLQHMWRADICRRIADIALEGLNGDIESLTPIQRILEEATGDFRPKEDIPEVPTDIEELLALNANRPCWKFNIERLAERVPGGAPGDFMITFARPELGKTAFWVSLTAGPGGFLEQGAKVAVLVNEEPGVRTLMRAIHSSSGLDKDQLPLSPRGPETETWRRLRPNFRTIDQVGFTMDQLNAYVERVKPDVLIIDQLDKVQVDTAKDTKDYQRLREVYVQAREIAKRHSCFVIGVSQASIEAEGKTWVHYSQMEGSKTGKAAEADLIIGIGAYPRDENAEEENMTRFLCVSKNKITGWHGREICKLENKVSRYVA